MEKFFSEEGKRECDGYKDTTKKGNVRTFSPQTLEEPEPDDGRRSTEK